MSLVRLLGFKNLTCGCVVGRYRDLASGRELTYVEEKGIDLRAPRAPPQPHRRQPGCARRAGVDRRPGVVAPRAVAADRPLDSQTAALQSRRCPARLAPTRPSAGARPATSSSTATARNCCAGWPRAQRRRRRHLTALQPGDRLQHVPRHDAQARVPGSGRPRWVAALARVLEPPTARLFLNVGSKPTDPWLAMDVAQAARGHLQLQNTIHWIKSIAIEKALAGARSPLEEDLAVGPLQADQQSTICPRLS